MVDLWMTGGLAVGRDQLRGIQIIENLKKAGVGIDS